MSGQARADAIFTLPSLPRRALVHGDVEHWRAGLEARGVELVSEESSADLVVTVGSQARPSAASAVVVDGVRRVDRGTIAGRTVARLASVPPGGDPGLLLNLGHRRAAAHALSNLVPPERSRRVRNAAASVIVRAGLLPPVVPLLVTLSREGGRSAFDAGPDAGIPDRSEWYLSVAAGSIVRRSAFHVLAPGSAAPDVIIKLSRVRDLSIQFDRDEAAYDIVKRAGRCVADHAPRLLARFDVEGHHASVETAARGVCLRRLLTESASADESSALASIVARWLDEVARGTAHPSAALEARRTRLAVAAEERLGANLAARLLRRVCDVPSVVTHGEVFEDHVFIDDGRVTLIDWEHAQEHGFPLWDLAFFAANALSAIDGVTREEPRDRYVERLFSGRAPSSALLFGWLRDAAKALDLDGDAVAALIALYWIERSQLSKTERLRAESVAGDAIAPSWLETIADRWFENPELGERWRSWQ